MAKLDEHLNLRKCPHCGRSEPTVIQVSRYNTIGKINSIQKNWAVYECKSCGMLITAFAIGITGNNEIVAMFPSSEDLNEAIPSKSKKYLQQAIDSVHAPSGAVVLCASAVDDMLKNKGLVDGSLYTRIDLAKDRNILTPEMATWAHQIRLDANDERHADYDASMATAEDAKKCIEFTKTLAELLFVLPSKVTRGLQNATPDLR